MANTKYKQGLYKLKNPKKYKGDPYNVVYRSSWELTFMMFCDNNPSVQQWASESVKIPYRDPLTGKHSVYVPDFLVQYIDAQQKKHTELWEIKPKNQTLVESVGKNPYNQAQYVKNMAKWESANIWCKQRGIKFRVINETDIFQNGRKSSK